MKPSLQEDKLFQNRFENLLFNFLQYKGGFFSKVNEFEFPAKIKSQIGINWQILKKKN